MSDKQVNSTQMDTIEQLMNFDPSNLDVFQEPQKQDFVSNIYKTNPIKFSISDDRHYRAKIKIIYNPFNPAKSIVRQATYFLQDQAGSFVVKSSLSEDDKNCPIFKSWKKLWFSKDEAKKEWAKQMYDKSESQWVLIQVLEDNNQPDLVGKFLVWKLPKTIFTRLDSKMHPSQESGKTPIPVMDYIIGIPLELDITPGPDDPDKPERLQREIGYDLCEFSTDYAPIINMDGTPFFSEEEMEIIDNWVQAKNDSVKAKTETKRKEAVNMLKNMSDSIKQLYVKAFEYIKEHALDLEKECGYQKWDEETTQRVQKWIDTVAQFKDPRENPTQEISNDINDIYGRSSTSTFTSVDISDDTLNDIPF